MSRAESLKIGYGAFSLGYALIWVTKEGKLFDKNGLDTEVLYLESNLVRPALISGDIPVGAMSGAAMATPKLQGADLVVVLGFQNHLPFRFVVCPEIKSVVDLKSKRPLANGSIDATVLNPPIHKRATEAGMRVMANMAEMGIL